MKQPHMTPRHFQFIAGTIRNLSWEMRERTAWAFAEALAKTHSNFDKERFLIDATRENKNGK